MIEPLIRTDSVPYTRSVPALGGAQSAAVPENGAQGSAAVPESGAQNASASGAEGAAKIGSTRRNMDSYECQTCEERTYQDGSDDPGVSFKTPTKITPGQEASAVRAHEMEHVTRNQESAKQEGREVVSQSVTYSTGICPECGRVYISGGTTRTVTKAQVDQTYGTEEGSAPRFEALA